MIKNTPATYLGTFVPNPQDVFARLWAELKWERRGGTPRREYYSNDVPNPYVYGKGAGEREYLPQPWHPDMMLIRKALELHTGATFEVCFLNGYEDQSDHLGWHADDSPEMDDARPIAIISLGAEREIFFRPRPELVGKCSICAGAGIPGKESQTEKGLMSCLACEGKTAPTEVEKLKLESGSLCLMAPGMQDTHQHRIPKAGFVCGERISLTFRGYVRAGADK